MDSPPTKRVCIETNTKSGQSDQPGQPDQPGNQPCNQPDQPDQPGNRPDQPGQPSNVVPTVQTFVFGSLKLTASQVTKSRVLAEQIAKHCDLADQPTGPIQPVQPVQPIQPAQPVVPVVPVAVVVDTADWPSHVVDATKWLDIWFTTSSAGLVTQLHGLTALDQLLAAAIWLDMHECVDQIVTASIAASKAHDCKPFVAEHLVGIYDQLVSRSSQNNFAPVSLNWPNVAELCWLCHAMPTILKHSLEKLWICKLMHTIDELWLNGCVLSSGNVSVTVPTSAIVGADWYGVAECPGGCHLFRSNASHFHQHRDVCSGIPVDQHGQQPGSGLVVARFAGKSVAVEVSPCQNYILWRLRRCTDDQPRNMVIRLATNQALKMSVWVKHSANMWWLGDDELAIVAPGVEMLYTAKPTELDGAHLRSMLGASARQSQALTMSTYRNARSTIVSVYLRAVGGGGTVSSQSLFDVVCADPTDPTGMTFVITSDNVSFLRWKVGVAAGVLTFSTVIELTPQETTMLHTKSVWKLNK